MSDEKVLYEGAPAVLGSVGRWCLAILTLGLAALVFWIQSKSTKIRITTERVVIETGLLSKRMEQTELYRIMDYVVERPFGQRLVGTGNLLLTTMDKSTPMIRVDWLPTDVVVLYANLRAAAEIQKRARGVRLLDVEGSSPGTH